MSGNFNPGVASSIRRKFRLGEDVDVDLIAVHEQPKEDTNNARNETEADKRRYGQM